MGCLYVVSTPIGNLEDITLRALRVLAEVGLIAAEDTRITARLLARHQIRAPMLSYRAPVEKRQLGRLLEALSGGDVALVSDAGTPTLSDPGQRLVDAAWEDGHRVIPIPGPSAITALLAASGLPGTGFAFGGYLPRKPGELRRFFAGLEEALQSTVVFESPYRIRKSLAILAEVLPERQIVVGRELTKLYEQIIRGIAGEVLAELEEPPRGEFTVVIGPTQRIK
ncbi:MAG: 16S rRNA (cytidine(1402)-2'-O)-methyltransferase [Candidatus Dormibacteraceae bacterium]